MEAWSCTKAWRSIVACFTTFVELSLDGGFGLGAATAGGAIGFGFEGTVEGRTSGVSGAKVVAGDEAIDDGNPGKTMGKSETPKTGTTGPFGTAYLSTGGGALVNATGGLLRMTFGRVTGGDFNIGRLLDCVGAGVSWLTTAELEEVPVLLVSSSSSIIMGWSTSAIGVSEEVAAPETGRGRSKGDALKISPNFLIGT